jgi:hypothetical protein
MPFKNKLMPYFFNLENEDMICKVLVWGEKFKRNMYLRY